MIRQPTPVMRLLAWHRAFMRGENPARHDGLPECGWFKMRRVKNGPWVPVTIWCDQEIDENGELASDETLHAEIEGIDASPIEIWTYLSPITKKEFEHLMDYRLRDSRMMDVNHAVDLGAEPTSPQI